MDAEIKACPHCGSETRAPFPETFFGPIQYGSGIKAYALNLLIAQMISLKRVQQSIQTLIGLAISEATILKYVLQLHLALARWEQRAIDRILTEPAMHVDESVPRRQGWMPCRAVAKMRVGPSESPFRRRLQTAHCCCVQKTWW